MNTAQMTLLSFQNVGLIEIISNSGFRASGITAEVEESQHAR